MERAKVQLQFLSVEVRLEKLGPDNWVECTKLAVCEGQRDLVDDNLFAVAEAGIEDFEPFAARAGDEMVGMAVLDWNPPDGHEAGCVLHHFMVDCRFQGRGYGKAALLAAIDMIRERGARYVLLSYLPGNPAVKLYESVGFEHTGEHWSMVGVKDAPSEPVMRLNF